jgi:hypothetical protein
VSAAVAKRLDLFGIGFVGFVVAAVFWLDPQFTRLRSFRSSSPGRFRWPPLRP